MKKVLQMLLVICIFFSFSIVSFAEEAIVEDELKYGTIYNHKEVLRCDIDDTFDEKGIDKIEDELVNFEGVYVFTITTKCHTKSQEKYAKKRDIYFSVSDLSEDKDFIATTLYGKCTKKLILDANKVNVDEYFDHYSICLYNLHDEIDSICNYDVSLKIERLHYAEDLSISNNMTLKAGTSKNVTLNINSPDNAYAYGKWRSSNGKIATVNQYGEVTAKKEGKCSVTLTLKNGYTYSCNVNVKPGSLKYSKLTAYRGISSSNKIVGATGKVKWTSSNKKIATVSSKGSIRGKKFGTCYVYAKYKGTKYKCKVIVKRYKPKYKNELIDYDTRDNAFYIEVKNTGRKTISIYSTNAKAIDADYKSYDRKLKLSGGKTYIKIAPGKTKEIRFKVIGSVTWWDPEDFKVRYTLKCDGKSYTAYARY